MFSFWGFQIPGIVRLIFPNRARKASRCLLWAFYVTHKSFCGGPSQRVTQQVWKSILKIVKARVDFVKKWSLRARQLQADEDALHAGRPDYLSHVLKGKRLLLLREVMESAGCPGKGLVDDVSKGFRISGWMPAGNTDPKVRRPSMSLETLKVLSKGINSASLKKLTRRQDVELETVTWAETESELAAGWVWKAAADNSCVFIATRFGIRQGPKIRLIDDCTCCGLNGTTGLRERFDLHTIDKIGRFCLRAWFRCRPCISVWQDLRS